jgi:hypothetical protein
VAKKTKVIRMKPFTTEEDWYRTYYLDIEDIPNELDSLEELAEKLLGWSTQRNTTTSNVLQNQMSNIWKNRAVRKKKLLRSSYLWRSGYIPRESGSIIKRNKHWIKPNSESDDKYKSSSENNNIGGKSNQPY